MAENWIQHKAEELIKEKVLIIGDGYRAKNSELSNNGLPFARAGNINQGFLFDNAECLDNANLSKAREKISQNGDVVFTSKGTVGRFAFVKETTRKFVYSPQLCYWRVMNSKIIEPRFLYFWMHGPEFFRQSSGVKGLTDMADYVSLVNQRRFEITLPPIEEQRRIAEILSALDEKIELNLHLNATLEKIAQAIFKQWFVAFQFPGWGGKLVDGLPKGWRKGILGDISINVRKSINPNDIDAQTPYFGLEHLPQKSIALSNWGKADDADSLKSKFSAGDILFGKIRPYFHKVGIAPIDGICSTDILVIQPKQKEFSGLALTYFSSDDIVKYATLRSNGAKMPRTTWADLANYEIVIPTKNIAERFSDLTFSLTERIKNNIFENQTLTQIRDSLLPKLMSGKIRVSS